MKPRYQAVRGTRDLIGPGPGREPAGPPVEIGQAAFDVGALSRGIPAGQQEVDELRNPDVEGPGRFASGQDEFRNPGDEWIGGAGKGGSGVQVALEARAKVQSFGG